MHLDPELDPPSKFKIIQIEREINFSNSLQRPYLLRYTTDADLTFVIQLL